MAESQYAGRGQRQNRWESEPGKNLTFSILLKPAFLPATALFDLNRAVSLGILWALQPLLGPELRIKWPNDIYYGGRKLGGILIENLLKGSEVKNSVIGIGLNINQQNFSLEVPNAVSIRQILQRDYDLKDLLSEICKNIEAAYLRLRSGGADAIRSDYLSHLYALREERSFQADEQVFRGSITGVRTDGKLLVRKGTEELAFDLKEIKMLNN